MKEFIGKTLEEALEKASEETSTPKEDLLYEIEEEKEDYFLRK